jgi:hypothetical protein
VALPTTATSSSAWTVAWVSSVNGFTVSKDAEEERGPPPAVLARRSPAATTGRTRRPNIGVSCFLPTTIDSAAYVPAKECLGAKRNWVPS